MSGLVPYLHFDGTARNALTFYQSVFGGELELFTYGEFSRTDGPKDAIAHGSLSGLVTLFAADAAPGEASVSMAGMEFSLLGTASPDELTRWFAALADGGTVLDALQLRPWGDHDGMVKDRFGVAWLIGYQG
ncbi:VOC family protein [Microbacterium schleiferi]|uniref:VOC family protein n=1 Tax=Microbacterium schleiferi TaxID=69362 RepID=A0A7S8MVZ4_9MICO|nr:VOC family protein [Microbacterium schleiferi]QPE03663.1 VOC family protein [Microbacterium schleiferi]